MGMSYLLDTHILLWWLFDDPKLDTNCRDIIRNPTPIAFSLAAPPPGKLPLNIVSASFPKPSSLSKNIHKYCSKLNSSNSPSPPPTPSEPEAYPFPIATPSVASQFPKGNRILMAQAELENLPIITYDNAFQTGLIQIIPAAK